MIRCAFGLLAVAFLVEIAPAQNKPEDVIKKSIDAHGGLGALKKFPAGTSKIAGKVLDQNLPYTGFVAFSVPGKGRVEMTFELPGQKVTSIQVVNGNKVSQTENGKATALPEAVKTELLEAAVIQEVSLLYPLLDATKYTIAADKDATVDGRDCAVVSVKAKGLKEVKLSFDKKTGYIAAMQRKGLSPDQKVVDELTTFSDYKTVEGMVVPMRSKVTHDGKAFLELTVTEYKPVEKLDERLFTLE